MKRKSWVIEYEIFPLRAIHTLTVIAEDEDKAEALFKKNARYDYKTWNIRKIKEEGDYYA